MLRRLALISSQAFSLINFRGPLIEALISSDIEVFALAPDFDKDSEDQIIALGAIPVSYSLHRTGLRPYRDFVDSISLIRILKRIRADVTLAYFVKPVIYGSLCSWLAGVPRRYSIIEGLGYAYTDPGGDSQGKRWVIRNIVHVLYKVALRTNEKVIFLNEDDIQDFKKSGLVNSEQVVRLDGIGVDLTKFVSSPPVEEPVTFLMMGRLLIDKGVYDFVEAARIVKRVHPTCRFILLGAPDLNPRSVSRSELALWDAEDVIEWHDHARDVRPWLAQSSVFVLPSYYREGLPRSTQEAMAMGRPVITTDSVGCRDTVEPGRNGFLVPPKTPQALADTMFRFIDNRSLIRRMGEESRVIAEKRFDVENTNRKILSELGVST